MQRIDWFTIREPKMCRKTKELVRVIKIYLLFRQGFALHELSNLFIEISMWIGRNRIHWWINYPVLELMETLDLTRKSPFCVFRLLWFVCCLWLLERERERERKCWWWCGDEETKALEGSMGSFCSITTPFLGAKLY
jgi:hypothetical protein